jgi:thiaminase/transcriptional activator TenA
MTASERGRGSSPEIRNSRLFDRLKEACRTDWDAYVQHDFVRRIGEGSLPKECFQHYLKQDYLFLIHFARAYALAVYKSTNLEDMLQAKKSLEIILDQEISLHVQYCADWDISQGDLAALPESLATLGYTRFVLERGAAGNLLDLHAALAPCVVGYAEVANWLLAQPWIKLEGNPYRPWIEMYAEEDYQAAARAEIEQLDRLAVGDSTGARFEELAATFGTVTRLEIGFWEMGLTLAR